MDEKPRLVIGISGASGVIYGVRLLEMLRDQPVETHLVVTKAAEVALAHETRFKVAEVQTLARQCHAVTDMAAPLASGSFRSLGMIVAPCSIRSMSEIATGATSTLLTRAADVAACSSTRRRQRLPPTTCKDPATSTSMQRTSPLQRQAWRVNSSSVGFPS